MWSSTKADLSRQIKDSVSQGHPLSGRSAPFGPKLIKKDLTRKDLGSEDISSPCCAFPGQSGTLLVSPVDRTQGTMHF